MPMTNRRSTIGGSEVLNRLRADERGFTLLEVITTCLLLGILLGIGVGPWMGYRHSRAHIEARTELVAAMRNAQISSVAENITYRVDVTAKRAITYRIASTGPQKTRQFVIEDRLVSYSSASFEDSAAAVTASAYFYPRGSASKGDVNVSRSGRTKVYTVSLEGLTARVSFTD
jgi:prepilin-type N-terminal cleavage/methylation domain-containing protein